MRYDKVTAGRFIRRRNRFVAEAEIGGEVHAVHVKNTGRCLELLLPGAEVFLSEADAPRRKTGYDLIAVKKARPGRDDLLINMDSQIPNAAALEWLVSSGMFSPGAVFTREKVYRKSRFDIFVVDGTRRVFIEVKGVTLEKDGVALFPDAPTERGVKHLNELSGSLAEGFEAYIFFLIQMKGVSRFRPNDAMHREFGDALRRAAAAGVKMIAVDSLVAPDSIRADSPVEVDLT